MLCDSDNVFPELRINISKVLTLTQSKHVVQTPMDISEIRWLSVWCPRFTVNFAEIFIPHDPKVPRRYTLSILSTLSTLSTLSIISTHDPKVPRRYFLDKFPRAGDQATLDTLRSNPVQVNTIYYVYTIYTI